MSKERSSPKVLSLVSYTCVCPRGGGRLAWKRYCWRRRCSPKWLARR